MGKRENRIWKELFILAVLFLFLISNVQATGQDNPASYEADQVDAFSDLVISPSYVSNLNNSITVSTDRKSAFVNSVKVVTTNALKVEASKFYLIDSATNSSYEVRVLPDVVYDKIRINEPQMVESIELDVNVADTPVYTVSASQVVPINAGVVNVAITNIVDAETGAVTSTQRAIIKNNALVSEEADELIVVQNGELVTLENIVDKEVKREKLLAETVKPLVEVKKITSPVLAENERFVVQVKKDHMLSYKKKLLESDNYDFIVVECSDLTSYLKNSYVVKICDSENLKEFINYSKEILQAEADEQIRKLKLRKTMLDVLEIPQLADYMDEDEWDVQPGQTSPYQQFVTPDDSEVQSISSLISTSEEAYDAAVDWVWVSDQYLHNQREKWLLPKEFIADTPGYSTNPISGSMVSDCSEQANTLVSVLRALGVPPEDVRVTLGTVNFGGDVGGHAWVEIKEDGRWTVLDPTSGSYYDEENGELVSRGGLRYDYWKYHPYPVVEVWCYYNDVYFTDEGEEIAPRWSSEAETATESDMWSGFFIGEELESVVLIYVIGVVAIAVIIFIFFITQYEKRGKAKE